MVQWDCRQEEKWREQYEEHRKEQRNSVFKIWQGTLMTNKMNSSYMKCVLLLCEFFLASLYLTSFSNVPSLSRGQFPTLYTFV